MAFRWVVRVTLIESGLPHVRPVFKDNGCKATESGRLKWTTNTNEEYPKGEEETVRALQACKVWCDKENAKIAAREARVEQARVWIKNAIAAYGQEVDQGE